MSSSNTFKSKFNIILLTSLSATVLLGCSIIFTITSIRSSGENAGRLSKASLNLAQCKSAFRAFLLNAWTDSSFVNNGSSKDILKFEEEAKELRDNLTILKFNLKGHERDSLIYIESALDSVTAGFKNISALIQKRGYKNLGLEGNMIDAAHYLENSPAIDKSMILHLRKSEKDFFLTKDPFYLKGVEKTVQELEGQLSALPESDEKNTMLNNLTKYKNVFDDISSLEAIIGLNYNAGLRGSINSNIDISLNKLAALNTSFEEKSNNLIITTITVLVLLFLIMLIGIYIGLNRFVRPAFEPIDEIQARATEISEGNLSVKFEEFRDNAVLKDLIAGLERIVSRFKTTMEQVEKISSRKILSEIPLTSENDEVGKTVNLIINQLQSIDNEEEKRTWHNEGLAKFAQLLRINSNNEVALYDDSIKELVKYLNANQGGLFIIEDEDTDHSHLLMKGCYAYDRKKFINKRIEPGEGLAGMCWEEGETIFMTEIPKNYCYISSGTGGSSPSSILIVPIKFNDKIFGVIELASFKLFQKHEVKFVEAIAESFGSAVHNMKTSTRTKSLLEKSQIMTEELRAQEEEMRQNMEELQATQEEMERSVNSMKVLTKELETREQIFGLTTILSEADKHGTITDINSKFCEVSGYTREELIGKPHNILRDPDMPKALFKLFWETIKSGKVFKGIIKNRGKGGVVYWVNATIVPIKDDNGNIIKYIGARYHIEDEHFALFMYNQQAKALGFPILETNNESVTNN